MDRRDERLDRNDRLDPTDRARAGAQPDAELERDVTRDRETAHDDEGPTAGDQLGEAVGGISGVVTGAAIGSLGGPIGTVIGGVAGALGGWWTGRAISEAASNITEEDDAHFRSHYQTRGGGGSPLTYENVLPAYQLGYVAAWHPDYATRDWRDVEPEIARGWSGEHTERIGSWTTAREFAEEGYRRGRTRKAR